MVAWQPNRRAPIATPCAWLPALAQTRAWLDRAQITYGETATLNIETSASVRLIDYSPLAAQFDIAGQTHYGYLQATVNADGANGTINFLSAAFESTPNTAM